MPAPVKTQTRSLTIDCAIVKYSIAIVRVGGSKGCDVQKWA
jgi:hypothetical protein